MKTLLSDMLVVATLLSSITTASIAQDAGQRGPEPARADLARTLVLGPDDVRAFPDAPAGFREVRPGVAQGRTETFASQRKLPFSMSASLAPTHCNARRT